MTKPFSPAALATWNAFLTHSEWEATTAELKALAAALRAAADQVVPTEMDLPPIAPDLGHFRQHERRLTRQRLLAIASSPSPPSWRVAMTDDDKLTAIAAVTILLIMFAVAWWWLPQKWQACQKLYDNRPAQIFCLGAK